LAGFDAHGAGNRANFGLGELRGLVEGYARCADQRDVEGFAALFTEDARLTVFDPDGTARRPLVGRDVIAAIPERLRRYERTRHIVSDPVVTDEGPEAASGTARCEAHHHLDGVDTVMTITYVDRYRRTASGWRIVEREVRITRQEDRPIAEGEGS
jgi:3-phenylpropionate/cinnamic acid dioxygenase small subunit